MISIGVLNLTAASGRELSPAIARVAVPPAADAVPVRWCLGCFDGRPDPQPLEGEQRGHAPHLRRLHLLPASHAPAIVRGTGGVNHLSSFFSQSYGSYNSLIFH